jgi:negative regulator of sigma E activity
MTTPTHEIDERLSAYFDGELDGEEGLERAIEADPELAAALADLRFMRTLVTGALEQQAERVPEARFEQIWDSFDRTLERESRLQDAAETPPSLWSRLMAWARPLRVPLATVGAASVLVVVLVKSIGSPEGETTDTLASNTPVEAASEQPAAAPSAPAAKPQAPQGPTIAVVPEPAEPSLDALSTPQPGEAEIKRIEFGGHTGTISQIEGNRGTTTVIWLTEDEEPVDTERSL